MIISEHQYLTGSCLKYELEIKDFSYLKDEFDIEQGNLGFTLISKKDNKFSISIGKFDIKYDYDISHLRLSMIAKYRISIRENLLYTLEKNKKDYWKSFIPKTTEQLKDLIDNFKYRKMFDTQKEEILDFLKQNTNSFV